MKIRYLEEIDSTQLYLKKLVREKKITPPYGVIANIQSSGVGSRDNKWIGIEGNLFLSFAIALDELPKDLKLESASIYFAYLLKETLCDLGSQVWLKWPNDFYVEDKKIGGMITTIEDNILISGVGINLVDHPDSFSKLDINISRDEILKNYIENIDKKLRWKQVFSKYKLEFYKSKDFSAHIKNTKISLNNVSLQSDGSIMYKNERIYSLR